VWYYCDAYGVGYHDVAIPTALSWIAYNAMPFSTASADLRGKEFDLLAQLVTLLDEPIPVKSCSSLGL